MNSLSKSQSENFLFEGSAYSQIQYYTNINYIYYKLYTNNQQQRGNRMHNTQNKSKKKIDQTDRLQTSKQVYREKQQNNPKGRKQQQQLQQPEIEQQVESEQSQYSSQDQDGVLLTNKVQQKLLTFVAKLKNKDPSIYAIQKPIFEEGDFTGAQKDKQNKAEQKQKKYTYKDMINKGDLDQEDENADNDEKQIGLDQIKSNIKKKLAHNQQNNQEQQQDLFKVKRKIQLPKKSQKQKLQQFISSFDKESSKLLTNLWKNDQKLDKTDLFLRNYILNQRWKTSKYKEQNGVTSKNGRVAVNDQEQQMIDQQDEERSVQMDQYEAHYNFRFQQPGSDKITQYPRQIPESLRQKSESRKQKRKRLQQRKKQQQEQIRKQNQQKKQQKKQQILKRLKQQDHKMPQNQQNNQNKIQSESSDFQHDWFFCDDCQKALQQKQRYYLCNECGQYMLCEQCHELIIHKHKMEKAVIPIGSGPPKSVEKTQKALQKLKNCKNCRRKIPHYINHYQYLQRSSYITQILCEKCYDQSSLQTKKKFKLKESATSKNYQEILEKNPEQIKQLTTQKDIEELVDEYLKYDFEDVIGGGLKTKFKYISVKPESYGLSDEQILYGDDKELNKYVSIKKLGAYEDEDVKLRNNLYKKKIKGIKKSVQDNKKILNKLNNKDATKVLRSVKRIQTRAEILRKRRQNASKKLRIINISDPEKEKKFLIPKGRLESYGLAIQQNNNDHQQTHNRKNTHKRLDQTN